MNRRARLLRGATDTYRLTPAPKPPAPPPLRWGRLLNRWHDEVGAAHRLRDDGSPACGVRYFASTGPYPQDPEVKRCRRCLAAEKRAVRS